MNILFEKSAVKIVCQKLQIIPEQVITINKGQYTLIKHNFEWIAILLKTEPFFNFGFQFQEVGEKGVGDSINVEHLRVMLEKGVKTVYTLFKNGNLYKIELDKLLSNSHRWMQKEGTMVRSFSIHHYEKVEDQELMCSGGKQNEKK